MTNLAAKAPVPRAEALLGFSCVFMQSGSRCSVASALSLPIEVSPRSGKVTKLPTTRSYPTTTPPQHES